MKAAGRAYGAPAPQGSLETARLGDQPWVLRLPIQSFSMAGVVWQESYRLSRPPIKDAAGGGWEVTIADSLAVAPRSTRRGTSYWANLGTGRPR